MTLKEFQNKLNATRADLSGKEIVVIAENGLELEPRIKFQLKTNEITNLSTENIDKIVITWD